MQVGVETIISKFLGLEGKREEDEVPVETPAEGDVPLPPKDKIKLVVFDMDDTILDIHTQGFLPNENKGLYTVDDMVSHIMPYFLKLAPKLIDNGFYVGIATFHDRAITRVPKYKDLKAGEDVIVPMLQKALHSHYNQILLACRNPELYNKLLAVDEKDEEPIKRDKSWHLRHLIDDTGIRPDQVLFFDDSEPNIESALAQGYRAFHVSDKDHFTERLWKEALDTL